MRQELDSSVSIRLVDKAGGKLSCSALLERDPGFLQWNRISLIGTRNDMLAAMRLQDRFSVKWELHNDPAWPTGEGPEYQHQTSGTASFRKTGMASGINITADSIQKFAELSIFEYREQFTSSGLTELYSEYWFLQRPRDWYAYPRRLPRTNTFTNRGDWVRPRGMGLKFRLVSIGWPRTDARLSRETELINIPGIEIRPVGEVDSGTFKSDADDLWFDLRILITFRFRQLAATLAEFKRRPGQHLQLWHDVEVERKEIKREQDDPPFYGPLNGFFSSGTAVLTCHREQREVLHAAAFGYAASYKSDSIESGLTNCVEAIERLVTVFEKQAGLSREILPRAQWRKINNRLKKAVDDLDLNTAKAVKIKEGLAAPITMSLVDRILRLTEKQGKYWDDKNKMLLSGLANMAAVRNSIVHGRVLDSMDEVYVELIRARAIFERLFLKFINCHRFPSSGLPHMIIADHEMKRDSDGAVE